MIKINRHIEIVRSTTKGLSSMSEESSASIFAVLSRHFSNVGITIINDPADLEALTASSPDLVFLGMEFIPSDPALGLADNNKVWLSDWFDDHDIVYTGSSQLAHELGRYKHLAKDCILSANLRTSAYCVIKQNQVLNRADVPLQFPLFVKPANRGGGLGIDSDSVVNNFEQLTSKVHAITTNLHSDALVEEYLAGREFSVAILKDDISSDYIAMPIELIAPPDQNGSRILSDQVKSANTEQAHEVSDSLIKTKVTDLALAAFEALGARDYGRIDIRLDEFDKPHFLEANLIPSLISGYGSFPKACILNIGLGYELMIMRIAKLGLARCENINQEILEPITTNGLVFPPSDVLLKAI